MSKAEKLLEEAIERFADAVDRGDLHEAERAARVAFALSILEPSGAS